MRILPATPPNYLRRVKSMRLPRYCRFQAHILKPSRYHTAQTSKLLNSIFLVNDRTVAGHLIGVFSRFTLRCIVSSVEFSWEFFFLSFFARNSLS
jgi:hypothetical protein